MKYVQKGIRGLTLMALRKMRRAEVKTLPSLWWCAGSFGMGGLCRYFEIDPFESVGGGVFIVSQILYPIFE
jgi:hypothetical protein